MEITNVRTESKIAYDIVQSKIQYDEYQEVVFYGIKVTEPVQEMQIKNISTDKQKIVKLLKKIKRFNVKPDFLQDIVEDFLSENYCDYSFNMISR